MSEPTVNPQANLLPTLLLVLFIGLKLGGVIAWPWLWVLSPLWIPLALAVVVLVAAFLVALAVTAAKEVRSRK